MVYKLLFPIVVYKWWTWKKYVVFWWTWNECSSEFGVINRSLSLLSGFKLPREMEYDFLAVVGDLWYCSHLFFYILGTFVNSATSYSGSVCDRPAEVVHEW